MTKQELMEIYKAEQLAEMVVELKEKLDDKLEFQKLIENQYVSSIEIKQKEIDSLKENIVALKILVADQKNTDKIIAQYNGGNSGCCCEKVGVIIKCPNCGKENKFELDEKSENLIRNKLTDKVCKLQSEVEKYHKAFEDAKKDRDCKIAEYHKKIEELTKENKNGYVSLQQDPIDIASDLIKAFCWQEKEYLPLECMQLRQIAEHLLVYCNHNGEAEE